MKNKLYALKLTVKWKVSLLTDIVYHHENNQKGGGHDVGHMECNDDHEDDLYFDMGGGRVEEGGRSRGHYGKEGYDREEDGRSGEDYGRSRGHCGREGYGRGEEGEPILQLKEGLCIDITWNKRQYKHDYQQQRIVCIVQVLSGEMFTIV